MNSTPNSLISIVITTYTLDRLNNILKLLDGLKAQTYQNIEIIIVVERSEPLFRQIQAYVAKVSIPDTKVIFNQSEPGASASRNIAVKEAKGDIIGLIDDDAIPFPDWAEMMVKSYTDDNIIGVTGPALPLWEDEKDAWFPKELHWIFSCTSWFECNTIVNIRHAWFENASFRREAFDAAGYLDTSLGPKDSAAGFKLKQWESSLGMISEDLEMSLRIKKITGKRIIYNPNVKVWHKADKQRLTSSFIRQWSYRMGFVKRKQKAIYFQDDPATLKPEQQLLKHIFTHLFPDIMKTFFTHPVIAWRKLKVTVTVLYFVGLGYYGPLVRSSLRAGKTK